MAFPRWLDEVSLSLAANTQLVLSGNVRDYHVIDGDDSNFTDTSRAVRLALRARAPYLVFTFDPVSGLSMPDPITDLDTAKAVAAKLPDQSTRDALLRGDRVGPMKVKTALAALMEAVVGAGTPCALLIDYAGWMTPASDHNLVGSDLNTEALDAIRRASQLCAEARPVFTGIDQPMLYNPIIWIVTRQSEIPAWMLTSPGVRIISIEEPGGAARETYGRRVLNQWAKFRDVSAEKQDEIVSLLAEVTEGFTLREAAAIVNVAKDKSMDLEELPVAQFAYRVGVVESEWEKPTMRQRICGFDEPGVDKCRAALARKLHGQDGAIKKAAEIVQRAVMGLAGAESSSTNPTRPKGVLFLAGPTGVGKTLLAKRITELVFGRPDNYTRFDMSEYSQAHTEARLVGAPPGYVGYSAGGQLTEAVRQRPFSLLLFDEIEKAHPLILDKFLQILDEGRLTDGSGMTVNFSETIIVFTSNLGILEQTSDELARPKTVQRVRYGDRFPSDATSGMSFAELEEKVRAGVRDHFVSGIRRPELLNRIGEGNLIVFDFVDPTTAATIMHDSVANVLEAATRKLNLSISLGMEAMAQLEAAVLVEPVLSMGGRGVNSAVETALVNPLAHSLALSVGPEGVFPGTRTLVTGLTEADDGHGLEAKLIWS